MGYRASSNNTLKRALDWTAQNSLQSIVLVGHQIQASANLPEKIVMQISSDTNLSIRKINEIWRVDREKPRVNQDEWI